MSLGLRKYILSDVKVEVTAISTPPPYEESDQFCIKNVWTELESLISPVSAKSQ